MELGTWNRRTACTQRAPHCSQCMVPMQAIQRMDPTAGSSALAPRSRAAAFEMHWCCSALALNALCAAPAMRHTVSRTIRRPIRQRAPQQLDIERRAEAVWCDACHRCSGCLPASFQRELLSISERRSGDWRSALCMSTAYAERVCLHRRLSVRGSHRSLCAATRRLHSQCSEKLFPLFSLVAFSSQPTGGQSASSFFSQFRF